MVGNLITAKACSSKPLCGPLHQRNGELIIRKLQCTKGALAIKHRARFHRKVVDRKMGGLTGNGLIQLGIPRGQTLTWQVLNEIETPRLESSVAPGLQEPVDRRQEVVMPMPPPQLFEHCVIKALPPQADAIHALSQNGGQLSAVKGGRIHFQGDFRTWLKPKLFRQGIEQCTDLIRTQERWRSPTDINR